MSTKKYKYSEFIKDQEKLNQEIDCLIIAFLNKYGDENPDLSIVRNKLDLIVNATLFEMDISGTGNASENGTVFSISSEKTTHVSIRPLSFEEISQPARESIPLVKEMLKEATRKLQQQPDQKRPQTPLQKVLFCLRVRVKSFLSKH